MLRNLEHTQAVHGFLSALANQARAVGWEVQQFDPPPRASRYFRYGNTVRSIHPDAFGILRRVVQDHGPSFWSGNAGR